ncbi:MAG TPA: S1/P1 nuclease [Sphingobium sp.]
MLIFPRRVLLGLAALAFVFQSVPATAWSWFGHNTIAEIAMLNVKPQTRAAVLALLARSDLLETPTCQAGTIDRASTWADCVRGLKDRFSYQAQWHFQDADACKPFDLKPLCKDGNCVSAQIERQVRLLKDKTLPERERVMAVVLLIHLVGDLHEPLHNIDRAGDGGGNGVNADYGIAHGKRISLHTIWDNYLAERSITTPPRLVRAYSAGERATLAAGSVADWSRESWELARSAAYTTALGKDYCSLPRQTHGAVSEAQIETLIPTVRSQVEKSGLRLARLLDEALGG